MLSSHEAPPLGLCSCRGPSKCVLLIEWDISNDTFQLGQWFKGRIYERRCDLSPRGDFLLYFAANYRKPYRSWSAISRPPFLTALALWPKGDAWGGGGHFTYGNRIALNHRSDEMAIAKDFTVPKWLAVQQLVNVPGGERTTRYWSERLKREGWVQISQGTLARRDFNAKIWQEFSPSIVWAKAKSRLAEAIYPTDVHRRSQRKGRTLVLD